MPPRDGTTGLPLPSPVVPINTVCVQMIIPDAPEYRQALRGVLSDLGKYWTWSHTVGQSYDPAMQAAEIWRYAASTLTYSEDCSGGPMACSDVANCIENDASTRAAVSSVASRAAQPGATAIPGERLPDTTWQGNLTPTDECSVDAFWAQCEQFVDYIVTAGQDVLEILETYSNSVEAATFIEMAPIIGTAFDEAQIDVVLDFIDWTLEVVKETYEAADTQPNRTAIACALFCEMKHDCTLTLEGAWTVINERLGGVLDPSDLNSTEDLLQAAVTLLMNPAAPLDTWLAIVLGLARVMGYMGVQGLNQTLNVVLKLAVNDANDDWILLCEDCPPPSTERTPVIASVWDPGGAVGSLTGPDEDGVWTVTTGTRAGDEAFSIRDVAGRNFVLVDKAYSAPIACQVWLQGGVVTHLECGTGDQYSNQVIEEFWTTWSPGPHRTMTFKMVAP